MKKNNNHHPDPMGFSESYEQYARRCSAECQCDSQTKSALNGGPRRYIPPSGHASDCPMGDAYNRWKANNLHIWSRIRSAVINAKVTGPDLDIGR